MWDSGRSLGHHMNSRTKDPTEDLGPMDTFKVVIDAARAAAEQWLPALVEANLTRPSDIAAHGRDAPPWTCRLHPTSRSR